MNELFTVFIGGGLGSIARYSTGKYVASLSLISFPFGTLMANLLSSLILGIFLGITSGKPESHNTMRFLIAVGFCGGFSTFSTFSAETLDLLKHGFILQFVLNVTGNLAGCMAMIGAGLWIGKSV